MRNEISTYTLIHHDIDEAIKKILDAGWKEIEIMCEGHGYEMLSWDDSKLKDFEKLLASHQASINFHAPISTFNPAIDDKEIKQTTDQTWDDCMRLANYFNSSYVLFHAGRAKDKEKGISLIQEFFLERINDVPENSILIIENVPPYQNEIGINSEELLKIGSVLPQSRWGICFDTGHSYLYSKDQFLSELQKMLPFLKGFHFNDNHGEMDEHLAVNKGSIPFDRLLPILKESNKSYFINYEMNSIEDANESLVKINDWNYL